MGARVAFIVKDEYLAAEPLGMMYLSSTLKQGGHETAAFNADRDRMLVSGLKDYRPDIIGVSTTSGLHVSYLELARAIRKEMDAVIVFGGPHPTFFPNMIEEECVDIVCRGEGEEALLELANEIAQGGQITGIRNLWVKWDGTIHKNPLRPFREDLDAIPFPDRKLIRQIGVAAWIGQRHFVSGRGCPYRCTYCCNHAYQNLTTGKYVRKRSVENLIAEIERVKRTEKVGMVCFNDDTFILKKEWVREFSERYKKDIDLPFSCWVRANHLDVEMCSLLREAGCILVAIGVETGNDRIRNEILMRDLSKSQMMDACKEMRRVGIHIITQNMIGLPGEDVHATMETIELNLACRPDRSGFSFFQPFPGTELGQVAVEQGTYDGNASRISVDYTSTALPLPEKALFETLYKLYPLFIAYPRLYKVARLCMANPERGRFLKRAGVKALIGLKSLNRLVRPPYVLMVLLYVTATRRRDRHYYYVRYLDFVFGLLQIFKAGKTRN